MTIDKKKILEYLLYPLLTLSFASLLLTFVVDSISRGSILESINFIFNSLNTFLFNALIIFFNIIINLTNKKENIFLFFNIFCMDICSNN